MGVSVCIPRIVCFDGHQENSEEIHTYYQSFLQFMRNLPAPFEAPEQQEEPFHAFGQWLHNASHVRRTGHSSKKIIPATCGSGSWNDRFPQAPRQVLTKSRVVCK